MHFPEVRVTSSRTFSRSFTMMTYLYQIGAVPFFLPVTLSNITGLVCTSNKMKLIYIIYYIILLFNKELFHSREDLYDMKRK